MKETNNFWDDVVRSGLTAFIIESDISIKNRIYDKELYEPIQILIKIGLMKISHNGIYNYYIDDNIQDLNIHIYKKVLPKISCDTVITSQAYIYTAITHKCYDMVKKYKKDKKDIWYDMDKNIIEYVVDNNNKDTTTILDKKIAIIRRLDLMIREQRYINKSSAIFLIGLKDYCLVNDFDVREFNIFIQEQMKISSMTYQIMCSKLKIRSKPLNEKRILNKNK